MSFVRRAVAGFLSRGSAGALCVGNGALSVGVLHFAGFRGGGLRFFASVGGQPFLGNQWVFRVFLTSVWGHLSTTYPVRGILHKDTPSYFATSGDSPFYVPSGVGPEIFSYFTELCAASAP